MSAIKSTHFAATKAPKSTFVDLFNDLTALDGDQAAFTELLGMKLPGRDVQESVLRLFARMGCVAELSEYMACYGNFNLGTYRPIGSIYDVFYSGLAPIKLKDTGDASDLTMLSLDGNEVLAITSKNYPSKQILPFNSLEIAKIVAYHNSNGKHRLRVGCCVVKRSQINMASAHASTTHGMEDLIEKLLVLDHQHLAAAFARFHELTKDVASLDDLINQHLRTPVYRLHQTWTIEETARLFRGKTSQSVTWGHAPRSGKTFMMMGLIERLSDGHSNVVVITTAPTETLDQYVQIFVGLRKHFSLCVLGHGPDPDFSTGPHLVLVSKQYLDRNRPTLPDTSLVFVDEMHHGGTTQLAQEHLAKFSRANRVFVTATYSKVAQAFPTQATFTWDLDDIAICRSADAVETALTSKHPSIAPYLKGGDLACYQQFPQLSIIGYDIDNYARHSIIRKHETWSLSTLLKWNTARFANRPAVVQLCSDIFEHIIPEIDARNQELGQRPIMGGDLSVVMIFLPPQNIQQRSKALRSIIMDDRPDVTVVCCNTTDQSESASTVINAATIQARTSGHSMVVVLTGTQAHLGITVPLCDLVILLTPTTSVDFLCQAMFRCMTEAPTKRRGYVVDMDIDRAVMAACNIAHSRTPSDTIDRIASGKLVDLRLMRLTDQVDAGSMICYDKTQMLERIQEFMSNRVLSMIRTNVDLLMDDQWLHIPAAEIEALLPATSSPTKKPKQPKNIHSDNATNHTTPMPDAMRSANTSSGTSTDDQDNQEIEAPRNNSDSQRARELIGRALPVISLLASKMTKEALLANMLNFIADKTYLSSVLTSQLNVWLRTDDADSAHRAMEAIKAVAKTNGTLIDDIVSRMMDIIRDATTDQLARFIDIYIGPNQNERGINVDVATPAELCKNMLDTLPSDFWTQERRVLEPCCGRGAFVLEVVKRFERGGRLTRQQILENCIYFMDINILDVFITSMLLDPDQQFKLNGIVGDALEYNPNWRFDAIIGGPPFTNGNKPFYNQFVEKFIDQCQYLLFVISSRWFSGGQPLNHFRTMMFNRTDLRLIEHTDDARLWFPSGDNIKGGVSYFMKDSDYIGPCRVNGVPYEFQTFDILIRPCFVEAVLLAEFLAQVARPKYNLSHIYRATSFFGIQSNGNTNTGANVFTNVDPNKPIAQCWVKHKTCPTRKVPINIIIDPSKEFWKVVTPYSAHNDGATGFDYLGISSPDEVCSATYLSFRVDSEKEAQSLMSYLRTPFANLMLAMRKPSVGISKETVRWIPLVPFDRTWTDQGVLDHLGLTDAEQAIIQRLYRHVVQGAHL